MTRDQPEQRVEPVVTMGRIVWFQRRLDDIPFDGLGKVIAVTERFPAIVLGPPMPHPDHPDVPVITVKVFTTGEDFAAIVPHGEPLPGGKTWWIWPPRT